MSATGREEWGGIERERSGRSTKREKSSMGARGKRESCAPDDPRFDDDVTPIG